MAPRRKAKQKRQAKEAAEEETPPEPEALETPEVEQDSESKGNGALENALESPSLHGASADLLETTTILAPSNPVMEAPANSGNSGSPESPSELGPTEEVFAPLEEAPAISFTPKPIPHVLARPIGFQSVAVPDLQGHMRQKVPAIPAVPRLQLDGPNCLTRGPSICAVPPALQASGFEPDLTTPLCGSGAYASVRRLRHVGTGRPFALKVVEKQPLHIRNMLPQLTRELGIQSALRHRHLLRILSKLGFDGFFYGF